MSEESRPYTTSRSPADDEIEGAGEATVQFRDPTDAEGFTTLPNVILRSPRLSPVAKVAYALLRSYAWDKNHAFPGQKLLAATAPCSPHTLIRALRDLQERQLIRIERRGLTRHNIYWIERLDDSTLEALK